jgi:hypothetical protein
VIYGEPGIGRSSFAWQLLELLSGDRTLAENFGLNLPDNLPNCKCIWLQCNKEMQIIEGVLLSLLIHSQKRYTFSQEFAEILSSRDFIDTVRKQYNINLNEVGFDFLFGRADKANKSKKNKVQNLFEYVIDCYTQKHPDEDIIIFLDNFDLIPKRSGVARLINYNNYNYNDNNNVRFVIIGIDDNINEIIEENPSAARKLPDSKFRIPRFNAEEINFVFNKAEEVANHQIVFEPEFREQVIFRSYGYPYLVQRFGYSTTQISCDSNPAKDRPLTIKVDDLQKVIDKLVKNRKNSSLYITLFCILDGTDQAKKEILRIVAQETDDISDKSIMNKISDSFKKSVEQNIENLINRKVLKRVEDNRVRFVDPEARILTQVYFDSEQKS